MSRRRTAWLSVGTVAVVLAATGLYRFQPWKLFLDHRVDEALPPAATRVVPVDRTVPASLPSGTADAAPTS